MGPNLERSRKSDAGDRKSSEGEEFMEAGVFEMLNPCRNSCYATVICKYPNEMPNLS